MSGTAAMGEPVVSPARAAIAEVLRHALGGRQVTGIDGHHQHQLLDALEAGVALEIMRLRDATREQRDALAASLRPPEYKTESRTPERRAEQLALEALPLGGEPLGSADAMMYGGKGAALSLSNWSKALALLALRPGGVRFGPLGWCAVHAPAGSRRWPGGQQVCPGCLDEEPEGRDDPVAAPRPVERVKVTGDLL